ncbi:MAG TPA: nucleotidyltransferase domain-containing protein [Vicinamibacterales bacterium]|nr:nucleotidyltransferase domain-containing protein [Vicinamibacterales bacterium]
MSAHPYRGNLPWLVSRTILLVTHGSHAYGLSTPASDLDIKGVAVPPAPYFHGFAQRLEQAESKDPDMVIFDVRKFFNLASECNPNMIEVLWVDESDVRIATPSGRALLEARALFLTKRAKHTFSGYAISQLKRINIHYRWLKHPPKSKPSRSEFGLPERTVIPADQLAAAQASIRKKLETWNLDDMSGIEPAARIVLQNSMAEMLAEIHVSADSQWAAAARTVGYDDNFIRILGLERQYKARATEWDQYQNWLATRNGYDCKHGMHLVRLMRMCREIRETGKVNVKRHDREELLAIRSGAWTYEQLVDWAQAEDAALKGVYERSTLPHKPDVAKLDALCSRLVEQALAGGAT